jgi:preprotein translocase subunit YajC
MVIRCMTRWILENIFSLVVIFVFCYWMLVRD